MSDLITWHGGPFVGFHVPKPPAHWNPTPRLQVWRDPVTGYWNWRCPGCAPSNGTAYSADGWRENFDHAMRHRGSDQCRWFHRNRQEASR